MCLRPSLIKNPNYRAKLTDLTKFKDCHSQYIYVPCGTCPQCIAVKQMSIAQRVTAETFKNHVFFTTLTYKSDMLPVLVVNDYEIPYADISDFQNMVKRIRKDKLFSRPLRYFAVTELGTRKGRPHMHVLWLVSKYDGDDVLTCYNLQKELYDLVLSQWKRNIALNASGTPNTRHPVYKPLCEYHERYSNGRLMRNYDTHYVIPSLTVNGELDAAYYVIKYMLKPSTRQSRLQQALKLNILNDDGTPDDESYKRIWNIVKPRYVKSLGFGCNGLSPFGDIDADLYEYLRGCIDLSRSSADYPCFVNRVTGSLQPLSRYYRSKLLTLQDAEKFYLKGDKDTHKYGDTIVDPEHLTNAQIIDKEMKFQKMLDIVELSDDDILFD